MALLLRADEFANNSQKLFRLALEEGSAGAKHRGVAEAGLPFRDLVVAIGQRLNELFGQIIGLSP